MYLLIQSNEDGNNVRYLTQDDLKDLLTNPMEYGIRAFLPFDDIKNERDPNYWEEDVALLLKAEVVIPKPVKIIESYSIED